MTRRRIVAAVAGALLTFSALALAVSESMLESAQRETEYAKAKAETAAYQAKEAKSNAEKAKAEKGFSAPAASGDAKKAEK